MAGVSGVLDVDSHVDYCCYNLCSKLFKSPCRRTVGGEADRRSRTLLLCNQPARLSGEFCISPALTSGFSPPRCECGIEQNAVLHYAFLKNELSDGRTRFAVASVGASAVSIDDCNFSRCVQMKNMGVLFGQRRRWLLKSFVDYYCYYFGSSLKQ